MRPYDPLILSSQGPLLMHAHANGYPPESYRAFLAPFLDRYQTRAVYLRPFWPGSAPDVLRDWRLFRDDYLEALPSQLMDAGSETFIGMGHSLGGMLAPDIGLRDGALAGIAILAAPVRPFLTVSRDQLEYLGSLEEDPSSAGRAQLDSVIAEVDRALAGEMGPEEPILGVRRGYWREVEEVEPVDAARRLQAPLIILQGARDYQSTEEDFRLWEKGLAGEARVRFKLYPTLSHLFTPGDGRATPEEYSVQVKHVDLEVIQDLADWITGQTASRSGGRPRSHEGKPPPAPSMTRRSGTGLAALPRVRQVVRRRGANGPEIIPLWARFDTRGPRFSPGMREGEPGKRDWE